MSNSHFLVLILLILEEFNSIIEGDIEYNFFIEREIEATGVSPEGNS